VVEVKFCGLTRDEDVAVAVSLGASYVGAIFAGGPRARTVEQAEALFRDVPPEVGRVGVFAADPAGRIGAVARQAGLTVVQLHGDPRAADVRALRDVFDGEVWGVIRATGSLLPDDATELFEEADAVVLDAKVAGRLGGTGVTLDWAPLALTLEELRGGTPVVLAGGLSPANVEEAVRLVAPQVVDVSSGVESAPGVKDHDMMRAFMDAARGRGE
jgi:phosphoribosylanthranilate isomerase